MNEAADAVWQVGSAEAIDLAMQKASITPKDSWLGPMNGAFRKSSTCWNLCGNDTAKSYRVSPLLRDMARTKQTFFS